MTKNQEELNKLTAQGIKYKIEHYRYPIKLLQYDAELFVGDLQLYFRSSRNRPKNFEPTTRGGKTILILRFPDGEEQKFESKCDYRADVFARGRGVQICLGRYSEYKRLKEEQQEIPF